MAAVVGAHTPPSSTRARPASGPTPQLRFGPEPVLPRPTGNSSSQLFPKALVPTPSPASRATSSRASTSDPPARPLGWRLSVLFGLSIASVLLAVGPDPPIGVVWVGRLGAACLIALVVRWAYVGFSGYERVLGARIVARTSPPPTPRWPIVASFGTAGVGAILLVSGQQGAALIGLVAACSLTGMVMVLLRRFTISAGLSVVGIALGVSALIVVQSVATGFQHEFERRVLGVYAHINVMKPNGISEYRRLESYLRALDGVRGASPYVYQAMALAPLPRPGASGESVRRATALVKGIEPRTAYQVMDIEQYLVNAMGKRVPLEALTSERTLRPVPDRRDEDLPPAIAAIEDPRGPSWYPPALAAWNARPAGQRGAKQRPRFGDDDDWPDEVDIGRASGADLEALPTMFVGHTLARALELEVDDAVMLVDPGSGFVETSAPEFRRYRVAGIFRAGFQEYDEHLVYVHIKELQSFKYRDHDKASGVDLRLEDPYRSQEIETELRASLGDDAYTIVEWQTLNAGLFQSIHAQKTVVTIVLSLVSVVAGFNVLTALWTIVIRRNADIAILMSIGASEGEVARVFQFSGLLIGFAGCVAGVSLGLVLCALVHTYGYVLDPEVYLIDTLPVEVSGVQIAAIVGLTMATAFVATIPPSLRAAKLRPVDGLRFE